MRRNGDSLSVSSASRTSSRASSVSPSRASSSSPATAASAVTLLLDPTSEKFVPAWLKAANDVLSFPHQRIRDHSSARPQLASWAAELYPRWLLDELKQDEATVAREIGASVTKAIGGVDLHAYEIWHRAIWHEHRGITAVLERACLYSRILRPETDAVGIRTYHFDAPHIRENWPPIDVGDPVIIVAVDPVARQAVAVFDSHVCGVRRVSGQVVIRCDELARHVDPAHLVFNVKFLPQTRLFSGYHRAVQEVVRRLDLPREQGATTGDGHPTFPKAWLYPGWTHLPHTLDPLPPPESIDWVDTDLNDEQKEAVIAFTFRKRKLPLLISGPPGTGKTKTVTEMVMQILKAWPTAHILVCGASGPSADTVAARLVPHLPPAQLLRLSDFSRSFEEVRSSLMAYSYIQDNRFSVPSLKDLLSKRVVVCTCDEAALLVQAHCTNEALRRLSDQVVGSLGSAHVASQADAHTMRSLLGPHWTHLIVDEAAQAHEPQICIPLTCLTPHVSCGDDQAPQICLCGDTRQLGPSIVSDAARADDMDCSLLERLLQRGVYHGHPDTRENRLKRRHGEKASSWEQTGGRDKPFVELIRNYRSSPAILMLPSALFYADSLVACAPTPVMTSSIKHWHRLPRRDFPVLCVGVDSPDHSVDEGMSWGNLGEVQKICVLISDLLDGSMGSGPQGAISPRDISVITPFREQVWRIRLALRAVGLAAVDVGNVESLQGNENRIVFISTVRATLSRIEEDQRDNRGLIFQPRRMNVALTRAKELLVVVGNVKALCVDPDWRAYIAFCQRNRVYEGVNVAETYDLLSANVSYMEEALSQSTEDRDLRSRLLAGAVANMVLKDG